MVKFFHIIFTLTFSMLLLTSCEKKSCDDEHEQISFHYNWSELGEVNKKPESMRLIFYPQSASMPIIRDVAADGYIDATLSPGVYQLITFTGKTNRIQFDSMDHFETAQFYLNPQQRSDQVLEQPDQLYGSVLNEFSISIGGNYTLRPTAITKQIIIDLQVNDGIDLIASCDGELSNLASRFLISRREIIPHYPGSHHFDLQKSEQSLQGIIHCFGTDTPASSSEEPIPNTKNMLRLHYKLTTGEEGVLLVDISPSLEDIDSPNVESIEVIIEVEEVEIGMNATLLDWITSTSGSGTVIPQKVINYTKSPKDIE